MNFAGASLPGKPDVPNEDWMGATQHSAVVLDGLSAPNGDTGCGHGTPWFVRHLGGHLLGASTDPEGPLATGTHLQPGHVYGCDLRARHVPS